MQPQPLATTQRHDMSFELDGTHIKASLPDLTIGVKDGNTLYTNPSDFLNRGRNRCPHCQNRYYGGYLTHLIKAKVRTVLRPNKSSVLEKVSFLNRRVMDKLDNFFIGKSQSVYA